MRRGDGLIQQVNVISCVIVVTGSDPVSLSGLQIPAVYSIQVWIVEQEQIYLRCPLVDMFEESS